jgi:putative inorganic carbon (hco3(-)) transporter
MVPVAWLRFDRVVLAAAVVLTAVLYTSRAADPVNVIKMTALVLCAVVLVASAACRVVRVRVAQLPSGPVAIAAVAFLLSLVVATVTAPSTTTAVVGAYGRNSGLLTYGSAVVLFLVGLRVLDRGSAHVPLLALVGAGSFTASYGLLQYVGIDQVPWNNPFNPIIATLGNPNFAAAYVAICTPAAVWGALRRGAPVELRVASGLVAVLCVLAAVLSDAAQGPLALAPGLAVLALAWLLDQRDRVKRVGIVALGSLTALGVLVIAAGVAGAGPLAGVFRDAGSRARLYYWEAALAMVRENPLLGVGLDTYGGYWRQVRSPEAVRELVASDFTDSAHSVPLHLLATGGLLSGLTYLAFLGLVAAALVVGLLRLRGADRLTLGALGGCWTAYQVQSFVSIDQVPLNVTQYVTGAGIVVLAGWAALREVRLPGAPPVQVPGKGKGKGRQVRPPKLRPVTAASGALLVGITVLALALSWFALSPLRANTAVAAGDRAQSAQDQQAALASYEQATRLLGGQSYNWQKRASFVRSLERPDLALEFYERAATVDRRDLDALRETAGLAEAQGEVELARRTWQRALQIDPRGPATLLRVAQFEQLQGDLPLAEELLERAVEVAPQRADIWGVLGQVRAGQQDTAGAREAFEQALALEPGQAAATEGLAALPRG